MDLFTSDDHEESFNDRIQRILNDKKRQELAERFGAKFSASEETQLPVDVETAWLQQLEEFEEKFEHARRIPLREYLGYPNFRPLAELAPDELENELNDVEEYLAFHHIQVDTLCEVPDAELYRFLTEELIDEEIDDMRISGMTTIFIYEEFHPNDEYDVKMWAEDFLGMVLYRNVEFLQSHLSPDELYTPRGEPCTRAELMDLIHAFLARNPVILNVTLKPVKWQIEGDYATVQVATSWESFKAGHGDAIQITGHSQIRLKRSPDIGWDVIQAKIAGWHEV